MPNAFTPKQVLAQFACRLRNADPQSWEQFVECFDAYATEVTIAVTNCGQHEILTQQGRAQEENLRREHFQKSECGGGFQGRIIQVVRSGQRA